MACADHPYCHHGCQPQSGTSKSSSTPAKNLQMSSIFQGVLDAFKLIGFQPNFKHSSLMTYADNLNVIKDTSPSQEHPQSSSTPGKSPEMSSIFERVLAAFKLIRFQPYLKHRAWVWGDSTESPSLVWCRATLSKSGLTLTDSITNSYLLYLVALTITPS